MPNLTAITLNDGVADTTYVPDSVSNERVILLEQDDDKPYALKKRIEFDKPSNQKSGVKRNARLIVPFSNEDGTIRYENFPIMYSGHRDSTVNERNLVVTEGLALAAESQVVSLLTRLEWFW